MRVGGVGLCGSDRHWFLEGGIGDASLDEPLVLGHEFAGVVASGPRAGERVVLDPAVPCGRCDLCLAGDGHLCADAAVRGATARPTGRCGRSSRGRRSSRIRFRTRSATRSRRCWSRSASRCMRWTSAVASRGRRLPCFGCGPIGLLLVQALRAAGIAVEIATDPLPHRAAAARRIGRASVPTQRTSGSTSPTRRPATTGRSTPRSPPRGRVAASCSSGSPTGTAAPSAQLRHGARS